MAENLNIGILGVGAIGTFLATLLSSKGFSVICITKEEQVIVFNKNGLRLESPLFGTITAHPRAKASVSQPLDILFVTVKSPFLEDALARVPREHLSHAVVIPLMNGIGHIERIRFALEAPVIVGTIGSIEVALVAPGIVHQILPQIPRVELASNSGVNTEHIKKIAALVSSVGIDTIIRKTEAEVIWKKLVRLHATASVTALSQKSVGEVLKDVSLNSLLHCLVEEGVAIARKEGVAITVEEVLADIAKLPEDLKTSLQKDIAQGKPSELEAITGGVMRKGHALSIPCPCTEQIYALLHEKIRSGITKA